MSSSSFSLSPRHLLTALTVIILWGMNFVVIKIGLKGIPPFLMGSLRFALVAFPAILFIPRPRVPLRLLIGYALAISLGQFAFLFSAMAVGMPAGLASLVLQAQAFFTVGFSALVFGDKLRASNLCGMLVAALGLLLLASASLSNATAPVSLPGFLLTLCAALSWAAGNVINKKIGPTAVLSLVSWSALVPILPFFALSWCFEGWPLIHSSLVNLSLPSALTIVYLAFAATLIGYTLWGKLLGALPTHLVAPLTLMVPVIGLTAAWLLLGEALSARQIGGALVIMLGLLINVFGQRLLQSVKTVWR
ncbi:MULTISPECIES: EamA family transporter [unclassified Undibacterium]|uniref:EamA family transporter n=1 Tax=unclassified Undibacterium TaxID=2630295 RepID=UPI002AC9804A|nr:MULTISPECIES: EamA family transporter [unclassified Undibacterium]MEB0138310.1 EamA family transporter [Undibacterium sp. CCC2.1]MEB0174151.1 EamA family transporter [Undibacterium sp. CCC1.1]MEB0174685.1 EamA family transporter [Undibacterium sp. CCC3.4]MEB0213882.1 EamA family transporter [Undibacterium sp. 5I2]WPX42608.1 EamA family transporter [Undibacterium sp. CCC3.4]